MSVQVLNPPNGTSSITLPVQTAPYRILSGFTRVTPGVNTGPFQLTVTGSGLTLAVFRTPGTHGPGEHLLAIGAGLIALFDSTSQTQVSEAVLPLPTWFIVPAQGVVALSIVSSDPTDTMTGAIFLIEPY